MDDRTRALATKRFLAKVDKNGPVPEHKPELGPCWLWKPLGSVGGYGYFHLEGRGMTAHRASYILFAGAIPEGLVIDHLCRVRNCVRPDHLEPVTLAENTRRAKAWIAGANWQRQKTHCPEGHPYSGDNLRIAKNGKRSCRTCERRWTAEHRARRLAENPPTPRVRKTHCKRGHPYDVYAYIDSAGRRACRECSRQNTRAYKERDRALKGPAPEKVTCRAGVHQWTPENIYTDQRGWKTCRLCRNERAAERYEAVKATRPPKTRRQACQNNHPMTDENTYLTPQGEEKCRECARNRSRAHEARIRAARPPKPPRTHCKWGHELAGDNLYIAPGGRKFCRRCTADAQARRRAGTVEVKSLTKGQWRRSKKTCPQGHPYEGDNLIIQASGGRKCRECQRNRSREYMRGKRAEAKAATPQPDEAPDDPLTLF